MPPIGRTEISIRMRASPAPLSATLSPVPETGAELQRISNFRPPLPGRSIPVTGGASMGTHYRADSLIGAGVCFGTIIVLYLLVVMLFG